jgi:hypothetical protein
MLGDEEDVAFSHAVAVISWERAASQDWESSTGGVCHSVSCSSESPQQSVLIVGTCSGRLAKITVKTSGLGQGQVPTNWDSLDGGFLSVQVAAYRKCVRACVFV